MDTWNVEVDQLARQFHESVKQVLDKIEMDCQQRNIKLNDEFIDAFYTLVDDK